MGGMFTSKQKTDTRQSTQVPLNFSQLMDRTIGFANQGLDTQFQSYNAPRIAELSANEQAGIAGTGQNAGMYQDLINMAQVNTADQIAHGGVPTSGDLSQFMNPYIDYVLNNSLSRLNEQSDTNMTKIGSTAAMSGAFGGTRHGVLEGANLAELLKSSGELSANTYSDAFDKGMNNWFQSQGLRRGLSQDAMGIATQGGAYNRADADALMRTGLVGRTRDQSVLDFAFSEFMREQQDPFTKAGFASSVMSSYPTNLFTRDSTSTTTQTPSAFSQIAGLGMAAAGLMTGNPAALAGLGTGQMSLGAPGSASAGEQAWLADLNTYNPKPPGFKKGGKVKRYSGGGFLDSILGGVGFGYLNNQKTPQTQPQVLPRNAVEALSMGQPQEQPGSSGRGGTFMGHSILDAMMGSGAYSNPHKMGGQDQGPQVLPQYQSQPRPQFNWDEFYQRQGLDRIPTAQSNVNPNYLNGSQRPDLSAFIQQLQQRIGGAQNGNGGGMPVPPFQQPRFAGGGKIEGNYYDSTIGRRQSTNVEERRGKTVQSKAAREAMNIPEKAQLPSWAQEVFGLSPWDFRTDVEAQKYHALKNYNKVVAQSLAQGRGFELDDVEQAIIDRAMDDKVNANSALALKYGSKLDPDPQRGAKSIPSLYAKGGKIQRFAGGGSPEDDNTTILDLLSAPRQEAPNFTEPDRVSDADVPLDYLLDRNKIFRLAVQKHETGAKEFGKPNYFANNFKGKENSHAFGLGQWQPGVYNGLVNEWNAAHPNDKLNPVSQADVKADKLPPKEAQDKIWSVWEPKLLASHGNNPTLAFAEHQLGAGDLSKILRSDGNQPMSAVVGGQIAKNVSASKETVNQYLKRLGGMYNDAYTWERANLIKSGGNLTDRVSGEGTDNPFDNVPIPDPQDLKRPKYIKEKNSKYLDSLIDFPGNPNSPSKKQQGYTKRQKEIEQELAADAYNAWRREAENLQVNNPDRRDVQAPTDINPHGLSDRPHVKDFFQSMPFTRSRDLPTQYKNTDSIFQKIPTTEAERNAILDEIANAGRERGSLFSGGGYVKKFDQGGPTGGGGDVMSRGMGFLDFMTHMGDRIKPIDHDNAFKSVFGPSEQEKSPWEQLPETSPDLESVRRGQWSGSGIFGGYTPDSPEAFNGALESGEPSDIVAQPAQNELNQKEDALTSAFKDMIMQEIEARKGRKEPDENKLFGMNVNMPLLKMGLSILANSGYPNSAGEAIGKGVLGTLENEQAKDMQKQERNANKLKELVNLRYMQAMVESMDPNVKMQLAKEKAKLDAQNQALEDERRVQLELGKFNALRGPKLEDYALRLKMQADAANPLQEDEGASID